MTSILPAAVRTEFTAGFGIQSVPTSAPADVAREIVRVVPLRQA
jgi:hypothetical protein